MNKKIMNEINVTPFIDVMLVLLVIFMITSPMMTPVIHVDLPKTKTASISGDDKSTIVTITNKGDIYLQDEITSPTNLKKRLLELSHGDTNMRIFVRGDKETNYGKIIKTISMIQEGGFTKVALITSYDNT